MLPQEQSRGLRLSVKEVADQLGISLSMLISLSTAFAELLSSENLQMFDRQYTPYDIMVLQQARNLVDQGLRYDEVISRLRTDHKHIYRQGDVVEEVDIDFLWGIPIASDPLPDPPDEDIPIVEPDPLDDITIDFPNARNSRWV